MNGGDRSACQGKITSFINLLLFYKQTLYVES